jgi:hypothetical protein
MIPFCQVVSAIVFFLCHLENLAERTTAFISSCPHGMHILLVSPPKEVTYENFLGCAQAKFKSERARTALIKNKTRQIIKEFAPTNAVYI